MLYKMKNILNIPQYSIWKMITCRRAW